MINGKIDNDLVMFGEIHTVIKGQMLKSLSWMVVVTEVGGELLYYDFKTLKAIIESLLSLKQF